MRLSTYFTEDECKCKGELCCGGTCAMNVDFMLYMDLIRAMVNAPLIVNSGFRCNKHNEDVGGVNRSWHTLGQAMDVYSPGASLSRIKEVAELFMEEVILYDDFVHIAHVRETVVYDKESIYDQFNTEYL